MQLSGFQKAASAVPKLENAHAALSKTSSDLQAMFESAQAACEKVPQTCTLTQLVVLL